MSLSEAEADVVEIKIAGRKARPIAPVERAFRWIVDYRSQPSFEHVPDRVTA